MQPLPSRPSPFLASLTPNNFGIVFYLTLSPITVIFALFPIAVLMSLMTGYYSNFMSAIKLSGYLFLGYYLLALPVLILLHAAFRKFGLLNFVSIFLCNTLTYVVLFIAFNMNELQSSWIGLVIFSLCSAGFYHLFCYAEIATDGFNS